MVEAKQVAKHTRLVEEVKDLRKELVELQNKMTSMMQEEVKEKVDEKIKEEMTMANATMQKMAREMAKAFTSRK